VTAIGALERERQQHAAASRHHLTSSSAPESALNFCEVEASGFCHQDHRPLISRRCSASDWQSVEPDRPMMSLLTLNM
jgi:hypothetical protein